MHSELGHVPVYFSGINFAWPVFVVLWYGARREVQNKIVVFILWQGHHWICLSISSHVLSATHSLIIPEFIFLPCTGAGDGEDGGIRQSHNLLLKSQFVWQCFSYICIRTDNTGKWARHSLTMLTCRGRAAKLEFKCKNTFYVCVVYVQSGTSKTIRSYFFISGEYVWITTGTYFPKSTVMEFKMSSVNKRINNYLLRLVNESVAENRLIYISPK
jgi:hypothetical protein